MDEELGATVQLGIGLQRLLLSTRDFLHLRSAIFFEDHLALLIDLRLHFDILEAEAAVKESECLSHSSENEILDQWPIQVEKHGTGEGHTDLLEPSAIEIRDTIGRGEHAQRESLLVEVSIDQKQKKGCVEELDDENSIGDNTRLLREGIVTNANDQKNDDLSEDEVDTNNHELGIVELSGVGEKLVTNGGIELRVVLLNLLKSLREHLVNPAESLIETV